MAARRLVAEWSARLILVTMALGLPWFVLSIRGREAKQAIEVRAALPEAGGWIPGDLRAKVGEPLHLRLRSVDVVHGFAIGQSDLPPVDLYPGETHELTLTFEQPGTYAYYCTRWCGVNHWRMRGTIEVDGLGDRVDDENIPLYLEMGIDLDRPRELDIAKNHQPSASRGAALKLALPARYLGWDTYVKYSPYELWQSLRAEPVTQELSSDEIWDLVAWVWQKNTTSDGLETGQRLYAENCSACHGESGQGDGVFANKLLENNPALSAVHGTDYGHNAVHPTDFTDSQSMLAASPALLQGKIIRGGMGTGMPYWGPIFTEEETWDLVAYLWTFQFSSGEPDVE